MSPMKIRKGLVQSMFFGVCEMVLANISMYESRDRRIITLKKLTMLSA